MNAQYEIFFAEILSEIRTSLDGTLAGLASFFMVLLLGQAVRLKTADVRNRHLHKKQLTTRKWQHQHSHTASQLQHGSLTKSTKTADIDGLMQDCSIQCWKFPQVRQSEADNFGGGPGTFYWFFSVLCWWFEIQAMRTYNFFDLSFKHWQYLQCISSGDTAILQ